MLFSALVTIIEGLAFCFVFRGLNSAVVKTPMLHNQAAFFSPSSPLSNMFDCDFVVDGVWCHTTEQSIVVQKAGLFGDANTVAAVKQLHNPVLIKHRGKEIKGLNLAMWR